MSFAPKLALKSRYAVTAVNPAYYTNATLGNSGYTTTPSQTLAPGLIWAPYLMAESIDLIELDPREGKRAARQQKLNRIFHELPDSES